MLWASVMFTTCDCIAHFTFFWPPKVSPLKGAPSGVYQLRVPGNFLFAQSKLEKLAFCSPKVPIAGLLRSRKTLQDRPFHNARLAIFNRPPICSGSTPLKRWEPQTTTSTDD